MVAQDASCRTIIRIDRWDWRYSFGLEVLPPQHAPKAISEVNRLIVRGTVASSPLKGAQRAILDFVFDPEVNSREWRQRTADQRSVSAIGLENGDLTAVLWLPADNQPIFIAVLAVERPVYCTLWTSPLQRREASVMCWSVTTEDDLT